MSYSPINMEVRITKILRDFIFFLVTRKTLYLFGMILVRFARKIREFSYKENQGLYFCEVTFMKKLRMRVDKNSYMGGSIYWTGFHHLQELLFLMNYLKPEMVMVDIGANQGEFAIFASSILTNGKVLAFEPVKKQRALLCYNIDLNKMHNISLFAYGLSNLKQKLPIYTSDNVSLHKGVHEGLSTIYPSSSRNVLEEEVELEVFDDIFFNQINRLDFIKIDIEGGELYALEGMQKSIEKFKPTILIELNEETFSSAGYSIIDVQKFFDKYNYLMYKWSRFNLIEVDLKNTAPWGNYIFKHK
jgi:FkbM family methyltransferase